MDRCGVFGSLEQAALEAYDQVVCLDLYDVIVDRCLVKATCGADVAGKSPVDRGKQGAKRSLMADGSGIPLGCVNAPANRNDSPFLRPTLEKLGRFETCLGVGLPERITEHLDAGYDNAASRALLAELGCHAVISRKGFPCKPAPAGSWNAPTPSTTAASRNWPSAPNAAPRLSTHSSSGPTPRSSCAHYYARHGPPTAGTPDHPADHDLLAQALSPACGKS